MLMRRRSSSGYRCVRERPSDMFYAEIRSGDVRLGLGTFETAYEVVSAYDVTVWRLSMPRSQMNFNDARTQELAPPPRVVTDEDRHEHCRRQRRLLIAEANEQAMAEWRLPGGRRQRQPPSGQRGGQIGMRKEWTDADRRH
ncbi:Glutathione S-transferase DHAR2 [Hordeum vulgare]|nr:Glutathione S-transferase DHAR2 [Hordeum vulgare]